MVAIFDLPEESVVKVRCTATRSVPALNVIAKVGEVREATVKNAKVLVSTGCFEVTGVVQEGSDGNTYVESSEDVVVEVESTDTTSEVILASDLTELNGVGPKTAQKLNEAGVYAFEQLIDSIPAELSEETGISEEEIKDWQAQAMVLALEEGGE